MFDIHKIIKKQNKTTNNLFNINKGLPRNKIHSMNMFNNSTMHGKILNKFNLNKFGGLNDFDFDGVPNKFDWQPKNPMRQDFTPLKWNKDKTAELTAAKRLGGRNLASLQLLGSGRDRAVYALDKDKVIKIAKNPCGLTQNTSESDLNWLELGEEIETGKDYVVAKRNLPLSKEGKRKLATVRKDVFENYNKYSNNGMSVQAYLSRDDSSLDEAGITKDILNYDFTPTELFANRQWGEDEEGNLRLNDGGALQASNSLSKHRVKDFSNKDWQSKEWQEVQQQRKQYKDEGNTKPYYKRKTIAGTYSQDPNNSYKDMFDEQGQDQLEQDIYEPQQDQYNQTQQYTQQIEQPILIDAESKNDRFTQDARKRSQQVSKIFNELWDKKYKGEFKSEEEANQAFAQARAKYSDPLREEIINYKGQKFKEVKFSKGDTGIARQAFAGEGGHIEYLSPDDFLSKTTKPTVSFDSLLNIYEGVESGNEFDPGFLEVDEHNRVYGHEGRHRAMAAKMMGLEKIPVAIVGPGHTKFNLQQTKRERGWNEPDEDDHKEDNSKPYSKTPEKYNQILNQDLNDEDDLDDNFYDDNNNVDEVFDRLESKYKNFKEETFRERLAKIQQTSRAEPQPQQDTESKNKQLTKQQKINALKKQYYNHWYDHYLNELGKDKNEAKKFALEQIQDDYELESKIEAVEDDTYEHDYGTF